MAEPKKRTNNSKQGMRRMHDKVLGPSLDYCPNCHQPKQRHIVCYNCGMYKKTQVIEKQPRRSESSESRPKTSEK